MIQKIQNNTEIVTQNQDITLDSQKSFEEAGLNSYVCQCYAKIGYKSPTPIQYYSIKTYLGNNCPSIVAQSKSGTGKTLSYISIILSNLLTLQNIDSKCNYLIIVPTRQLSLQVYQIFKEVTTAVTQVKPITEEQKNVRLRLKQIKLMMCIGGIPFQDDRKNYQLNGGNIIVGTIGRVTEMVQKRLIKVSELQMLILDQGDKLFQNKNSRFSSLIQQVINHQKDNNYSIKLMIYSATFTSKLLRQLIKKRQYMFIQTLADQSNTLQINITSNFQQVISIDNSITDSQHTADSMINLDNIKKYKFVADDTSLSFFNAKIVALIKVLQQLNYQRCLVFVEKKTLLEQINQRIIGAGLEPLLIHGSLSQSSRIKLMNQINHSKIIVASDLLARGIDLELDLVILFDAKRNDTFWHRIGRTGRYGKMGVAISLDQIEDWQKYDRETVQQQLNMIQTTFNKNKDWYGTYLTEVGDWKATDVQQQMKLQKQYKYFDEEKAKLNHNIVQKASVSQIEKQTHFFGQHLDINSIKTQKQLKLLITQLLGCNNCCSSMKSIEQLTGYHFQIKQYLTNNDKLT